MAYITGTADNYVDLMSRLRQFALGYPTIGAATPSGVGNGTVTNIEQSATAVAETWTLTCSVVHSTADTTITVVNGDAETTIGAEWIAYNGLPKFVRTSSIKHSGTYSFQASTGTSNAGQYQRYDLVAEGVLAADIDAGACDFIADYWIENDTEAYDFGRVSLIYLDASLVEISRTVSAEHKDIGSMINKLLVGNIPSGARHVDLVLEGVYVAGSANNVYIDDVTAKVTTYNGRFTVSGSVSGAQADAPINRRYLESSLLSFKLTDGATPFAVSDSFTVVTSTNALPSGEYWIDHRYKNNWQPGSDSNFEWIGEGPGASGTDNIIAGVVARYDIVNTFPTYVMNGFTGYTANLAFKNQPGAIPEDAAANQSPPRMAMWENNTVQYWFMVSGRRIIIIAKMGSVYEMGYLGFIQPFATPVQYPYPLFVGGTGPGIGYNHQVSNTTDNHSAFWNPTKPTGNPNLSGAQLREPGGGWSVYWNRYHSTGSTWNWQVTGPLRYVWPYAYYSMKNLRENLDGSYPMFPVVLGKVINTWVDQESSCYGKLDGVNAIAGQGLASEDVITYGGDSYLVVQNTFRTANDQFCAVRLA